MVPPMMVLLTPSLAHFPAMVTMIVATILMAIPATMLLPAVFALILAATKDPRYYFHFSYRCCRIITCDHDFTRPRLPLRGFISNCDL